MQRKWTQQEEPLTQCEQLCVNICCFVVYNAINIVAAIIAFNEEAACSDINISNAFIPPSLYLKIASFTSISALILFCCIVNPWPSKDNCRITSNIAAIIVSLLIIWYVVSSSIGLVIYIQINSECQFSITGNMIISWDIIHLVLGCCCCCCYLGYNININLDQNTNMDIEQQLLPHTSDKYYTGPVPENYENPYALSGRKTPYLVDHAGKYRSKDLEPDQQYVINGMVVRSFNYHKPKTPKLKSLSCESIKECKSAQEINKVLSLYNQHEHKSNQLSFEQVLNQTYEGTYSVEAILNDYIHIISAHGDSLEEIYDKINMKCDLSTCHCIRRNQRDRMKLYEDFSDDEVVIDAMDEIHCYVMHTFDTGYRLTKMEKQKLEQAVTDIDDSIDTKKQYDINTTFQIMGNVLYGKRERFKNIARVQYSKFVTKINEEKDHDHASVDQVIQVEHSKQYSLPLYSFSYRFNYNTQNKMLNNNNNQRIFNCRLSENISILPKYDSLKDELISNNICCVPINVWNEATMKSEQRITTNRAKKLKSNLIGQWFYGLPENTPISTHNLMTIIFYTDFDLLSSKFSETFRKLDSKETMNDVVQRHKEYYWFGRILRETVECYDIIYDQHSKQTYYHGISCLMAFPSTIASFNGPTSTTQKIVVAQAFATNAGCILNIGYCKFSSSNPKNNIPCFECSWIAAFANEDETIFYGGYRPLEIINIINCSDSIEYKTYLMAINQLLRCFNCEAPIRETSNAEDIIDQLFFEQNNKNKDVIYIPQYVKHLFNCFRHNLKTIRIHISEIEHYASKYYLSLLWSSPDDVYRGFIKLENICKTFINLEQIIIEAGSIARMQLSLSYFDDLSSSLIEYNCPSLKEIYIKPLELDPKCSKTNISCNDVPALLKLIQPQFTNITRFKVEYKPYDHESWDHIKLVKQ